MNATEYSVTGLVIHAHIQIIGSILFAREQMAQAIFTFTSVILFDPATRPMQAACRAVRRLGDWRIEWVSGRLQSLLLDYSIDSTG